MDEWGAGGIGASIVSVLTIVYVAVNHKRLRSNCCGYPVVVAIDIEPTSPVKEHSDKKVDDSKN